MQSRLGLVGGANDFGIVREESDNRHPEGFTEMASVCLKIGLDFAIASGI
jgi:hypothetical protein